jgi:hypothetical protein
VPCVLIGEDAGETVRERLSRPPSEGQAAAERTHPPD